MEHFNSNIKWKFDDTPGINEDMHALEQNLDRIRSLSHEKSFNGYGIRDNDNLLEVELNNIIDDDSDEMKDSYGMQRENSEEKSEYNLSNKFSRHSSLSNRELDVIKESSRSSSDTEVTLT